MGGAAEGVHFSLVASHTQAEMSKRCAIFGTRADTAAASQTPRLFAVQQEQGGWGRMVRTMWCQKGFNLISDLSYQTNPPGHDLGHKEYLLVSCITMTSEVCVTAVQASVCD